MRGLPATVTAAAASIKAAAEALAVLDVSAALAQVAVERNYLRPEVDDTLAFVVEGGRHPVVEQALAQDGQPFVANDCDLSPAASRDRRPHLSAHRPQYGRQIHFPAAERLDRRAGADGQLRACAQSSYRHRRPAVLPRRRGRRSRARPLHLHGRDGGNGRHPQSGARAFAGDPRRNRPRHRDLRWTFHRLGHDRASARGQPLPRAVRHPLSRTDGACRRSCRACSMPPRG